MNLFFRVLWMLLTCHRRRHLGFFNRSELVLRALPNDMDINIHMNNGRYLTLLDLGRMDLLLRIGMVPIVWRRRWMPVVAGVMGRFRRSIGLFERFTLTTRVIGWDERFFYIEQAMVTARGPALTALVRCCYAHQGRLVPSGEVMAALGLDAVSPPLPEAVLLWERAETAMVAGEDADD